MSSSEPSKLTSKQVLARLGKNAPLPKERYIADRLRYLRNRGMVVGDPPRPAGRDVCPRCGWHKAVSAVKCEACTKYETHLKSLDPATPEGRKARGKRARGDK
jgi:hypothetical protein